MPTHVYNVHAAFLQGEALNTLPAQDSESFGPRRQTSKTPAGQLRVQGVRASMPVAQKVDMADMVQRRLKQQKNASQSRFAKRDASHESVPSGSGSHQ